MERAAAEKQQSASGQEQFKSDKDNQQYSGPILELDWANPDGYLRWFRYHEFWRLTNLRGRSLCSRIAVITCSLVALR
jgi:hypothetical protein